MSSAIDNSNVNIAQAGRGPNVIGHGVGAALGIAGLVWGSSNIQHQIQLQVAAVANFRTLALEQ